ncbi:MAG: hemolysin family protein [Lentisphaerae bacterium]|nr:hemolysin family protein [Lentisphaerota bacterium]
MTELLQVVLILLCMAGCAFYAGIETGVISIHRMRLRHFSRQGEPGADILEEFLKDSDRLLGTTLTGTNLFLVLVSVFSASLGRRLHGTYGESVAAAVTTIIVVVFCEYLPKAWFHSRPLARSLRFARLLQLSEALFRPLSVTVVGITRWLIPGAKASLSETVPFVTRDDLLALAREGEEHGVLSREERVMIHRVFDLSRKVAREIMVPRAQMTFVTSASTIPEIFEKARTSGFTRLPVFHAERNEFVGILNVSYVLTHAAANPGRTAEWFARPQVIVHERTPVDNILPLMRRSRQPLALVQNDREEITGLLTTEDVLDEIVGQL